MAPLMTGLIADLVVDVRRVALTEPFVTSRGSVSSLTMIDIEVIGDDGHRGRGSVAPATRLTGETAESIAAVIRLCGPLLIGRPQLPLSARVRDIEAYLPGNAVAKCGLDLALHALTANVAGVGLPALLAAPDQPRVMTDVTVVLGDAETMAEAARARVDEGYTTLKVKVGEDTETDLGRILAVVAATEGRATLRLDANQGWSPRAAVRLLTTLSDRGIELELVEQPVHADDLVGMRYVRQRIPYAVMADESVRTSADVLRVAEREAADLVNLKLAKHGGLLRTREIAAVAQAVGLACSVGSMMEAVDGVAASVALASTLAWSGAHDLDAARWLAGRRAENEPAVEYRPPMVLARWPDPPNR